MRFITDYHRLNHKLVMKTYLLPRIGKKVQNLDGSKYATVLDINMGYYTLRRSPASQDMTAIVTEFWKLRYNRLPMGMCA